MNSVRVGLIGHLMYADEAAAVNGQAVKTRNYLSVLRERYGSSQVSLLDTNYFRKHLVSNYIKTLNICKKCDTVLILPTKNGLKLLLPVLRILKKIYHFRLLYPVIGGWLPQYIDETPLIRYFLQCVDDIYLETDQMTDEMKRRGFVQSQTVVNFSLRDGKVTPWNYSIQKSICRCFTFSRVTKTKGIGEAIEAVRILNEEKSDICYTLDVYGPIDEAYRVEFENTLKKSGDYIHYRGVLADDTILPTLSEHELMLFPTYYEGEGMPGAVIESFMAGIPVVASNWHNNAEVVKNGYTGVIYPLDSIESLINAIKSIVERDGELDRLHDNCMLESKKYQPDIIMQPVFSDIERT